MLKDYLIITWLTIIAGWPYSLTVIGLLTLWCLVRHHRACAVIGVVIWCLVALAAWQFEKYWS